MSEFEMTREDDELLARLREGLSESDSVPSDVTIFAKAAFSWRTIDADLAELEYDSVDEELPAGVRSSATARMISFQAGQGMLDVEYDEPTGRLLGHISPRAAYTVEVHFAGGLFTVESDELGRFEADGVDPGPVSMVLRFADGSVIKTQWVILWRLDQPLCEDLWGVTPHKPSQNGFFLYQSGRQSLSTHMSRRSQAME